MKGDLSNIIKKIKDCYSINQTFTRNELYDFLESNFFPNLKETTFRWRIYDLKNRGVIVSVTKGVFKLSVRKHLYKPNIKKLTKFSKLLTKDFPLIKFCLWSSNWLNEFSRHQAANEIIFVEVEKDLVNSVFNLLMDSNFKNVFIEPDKFVTETYVSENKTSIIVKSLVTKSPTQMVAKVSVPKLEKILVDLFSDDKYLSSYKGFEQKIIFENAFEKYQLNLTKLINYSRRRKKDKIIRDFLISEKIVNGEILK